MVDKALLHTHYIFVSSLLDIKCVCVDFKGCFCFLRWFHSWPDMNKTVMAALRAYGLKGGCVSLEQDKTLGALY